MSYFEEIKLSLGEHVDFIKSISTIHLNEKSRKKIEEHVNSSILTNKTVDTEDPNKLKLFIEYLEKEGRIFGWSFPENEKEEMCEDSFWSFKNKMEKLIGGMTGNERLYYFGYLEEFENLAPHHKAAKDAILLKLFMH